LDIFLKIPLLEYPGNSKSILIPGNLFRYLMSKIFRNMKQLISLLVAFSAMVMVNAQDAESAKPGVIYGKYSEAGMTPISVNDLEKKMTDNKFDGKIQGKVVEVCQAMGCWAKLKKEDGSMIMIKVKDHEFAMPLDIVGKTVVVEGKAELKETSVAMLKHYAEDAGKSKEEIEKIKEPKKEVIMMIKGVKVVE
jgi:hypothetical protein